MVDNLFCGNIRPPQIETVALIFGLDELSLIDQLFHNSPTLMGRLHKFSDRFFSHGVNCGNCQQVALHIARKIKAISFISHAKLHLLHLCAEYLVGAVNALLRRQVVYR